MTKNCEDCGDLFNHHSKTCQKRFCDECSYRRKKECIKDSNYIRSNIKKICKICGKEFLRKGEHTQNCYILWSKPRRNVNELEFKSIQNFAWEDEGVLI